jgi:hypothetical protein
VLTTPPPLPLLLSNVRVAGHSSGTQNFNSNGSMSESAIFALVANPEVTTSLRSRPCMTKCLKHGVSVSSSALVASIPGNIPKTTLQAGPLKCPHATGFCPHSAPRSCAFCRKSWPVHGEISREVFAMVHLRANTSVWRGLCHHLDTRILGWIFSVVFSCGAILYTILIIRDLLR